MLEFLDETFPSKNGARRALVVSPRVRVELGRARLDELRQGLKPGEIDLQMLQEVRRRRGRLHALVMRGRSADGAGEWTMSPELSEDERLELGYLLSKSHLPNHRRFMACGVCVYVHADFGAQELVALRAGAERLAQELEAARSATAEHELPILQADLWILKNLSFWFGLSAERVLGEILPEQIALFEARLPHMNEIVAALPRHAR